ncbi:hypothetical protein [Mycolicibacterium mageritense]|uniref:hypothetical protein n=1 Tax=Mycolicibacterium mageritense TaxID=53462 RepID=UPI00093DCAE9|nr:hypothetical protein [Mycolicibacterium mageritense]OKH65956.1 hypothetical protein EB73_20840 [Mycobacterium sp. SWH-M3]GJJ17207.1 hypothetical protein MTY414_08800 [Mycolicibacterium mageritense]
MSDMVHELSRAAAPLPQQPGQPPPPRVLMLGFDPDGYCSIAVGDPDQASHVTFYVPNGRGQPTPSYRWQVELAAALRQRAAEFAGNDQLAIVVLQGYAPGHAANRLLTDLAAARPRQITLVGYGEGCAEVAAAARTADVDRVVLIQRLHGPEPEPVHQGGTWWRTIADSPRSYGGHWVPEADQWDDVAAAVAGLDGPPTSPQAAAPASPPIYAAAPSPTPPTPVAHKRRPWILLPLVLIGLVVTVVAGLVVINKTTGDGAREWPVTADETVHPDEAAGLPRASAGRLTAPMPGQLPAVVATTSVPGEIIGGNVDFVVATQLSAPGRTDIRFADPRTGADVRPANWIDTELGKWQGIGQHCAFADRNRVGCLTYHQNDPNKTVLVILDHQTGTPIRAVETTRKYDELVAAGERFILISEVNSHMATGIDLDGREVWTTEATTVLPNQSVMAFEPEDYSQPTRFMSTIDGHEILTAPAPRAPQIDHPTGRKWGAYNGGIAVLNEERTATDFYDVNGVKTASLAGWRPQGGMHNRGDGTPLPIVTRIEPTEGDTKLIGAANPATGHLLWKADFVDDSLPGKLMSGRGEFAVLKDPSSSSSIEKYVVFNCYTGERSALTPKANIGVIGQTSTDGERILFSHSEGAEMFDLRTGTRLWEIPGKPALESFDGLLVRENSDGALEVYR